MHVGCLKCPITGISEWTLRTATRILCLFLLLLPQPGCAQDISKINVTMLNQKAVDGANVLSPQVVLSVQELADQQGGSTVHRYTQEEAKSRACRRPEPFPGLVATSLVIDESDRPTRSQHASSITEVAPGVLVGAWFGGTYERMGDVGIWLARRENGKWGKPRQLFGPLPDEHYQGSMAPCWNPVVLHNPKTSETLLFFKVLPLLIHWDAAPVF